MRLRLATSIGLALMLVSLPGSADTKVCTDDDETACYHQWTYGGGHDDPDCEPAWGGYVGVNGVTVDESNTGLDADVGFIESCGRAGSFYSQDASWFVVAAGTDDGRASVVWYEAEEQWFGETTRDECMIIVLVSDADDEDVTRHEFPCPADQGPPTLGWGQVHPDA